MSLQSPATVRSTPHKEAGRPFHAFISEGLGNGGMWRAGWKRDLSEGNVQNIRGIWERKGKAHFARGTTSVVWGLNICRQEHGGRAFWENISDIIPTVSGVLGFGYKWPSNVFVRFVLLVPGAHRDPCFVLTWEINHSLGSMAEFSCAGKGGWEQGRRDLCELQQKPA